MEIFKLAGSVYVDTEKANDSLQKTDKKASNLGDTLGKIGKVAGAVGGAVVAGTTAAVSGIMSLTDQTAAAADEIDKASIRMGMGAEEYQRLAYAAGQCGVDMSVMERAAKRLEGTDISMDEAMAQIMAIGTAEERAAKAAELFGEVVAYNMSPLIEQSTESYDDLIRRADELGIVMSQDAVTAGVVLGDTISDVKQSFTMLVNNLGSSVVPVVQSFADMILEFMPTIQSMVSGLAPVISGLFENLVPPIMSLADQFLPVIFDLVEQLLPPISEIMASVLPIIVQLVSTLMPFVVRLTSAVLPVLVNLLNLILPILQPILQLLQPILDLVIAIIEPVMKIVNAVITPLVNVLKTLLMPVIAEVQKQLQTFSSVFSAIFDALPGFLKGALNGVIGVLNKMITGVNVILTPLRAIIYAVGDLFGANWNFEDVAIPQIPYLAKGGHIVGSGSAIVGEEGPELVSMPAGASVTPLGGNSGMDAVVAKLNEIIDMMSSMAAQESGVYIDGTALVGKIAPKMDKALGRLVVKNGRYV